MYLGSRGIVLSITVAKIKALISFAVTAKPICVFVFAYVESRFSHDAAHNKCVAATSERFRPAYKLSQIHIPRLTHSVVGNLSGNISTTIILFLLVKEISRYSYCRTGKMSVILLFSLPVGDTPLFGVKFTC